MIIFSFRFRSKTQHLDELSDAISEYADAVNLLTLNVRLAIHRMRKEILKKKFCFISDGL